MSCSPREDSGQTLQLWMCQMVLGPLGHTCDLCFGTFHRNLLASTITSVSAFEIVNLHRTQSEWNTSKKKKTKTKEKLKVNHTRHGLCSDCHLLFISSRFLFVLMSIHSAWDFFFIVSNWKCVFVHIGIDASVTIGCAICCYCCCCIYVLCTTEMNIKCSLEDYVTMMMMVNLGDDADGTITRFCGISFFMTSAPHTNAIRRRIQILNNGNSRTTKNCLFVCSVFTMACSIRCYHQLH